MTVKRRRRCNYKEYLSDHYNVLVGTSFAISRIVNGQRIVSHYFNRNLFLLPDTKEEVRMTLPCLRRVENSSPVSTFLDVSRKELFRARKLRQTVIPP